MQETLSTFPEFNESLKNAGTQGEEASAQYIIRVAAWKANIVAEINRLLENKQDLRGLTPEMILNEILGTRKQ